MISTKELGQIVKTSKPGSTRSTEAIMLLTKRLNDLRQALVVKQLRPNPTHEQLTD